MRWFVRETSTLCPAPLHGMKGLPMNGSPLTLMSQLKLPPNGPLQSTEHWPLLIPKILPHHSLFLASEAPFLGSPPISNTSLLLKLKVLNWHPGQSLKSSTIGSRGEEPLEIVYTQIWMCTWGGHLCFILSTNLRSPKVITHCHKPFSSVSFPSFNCCLRV